MNLKGFLPVLLVPLAVLMIPLTASQFLEGWNWSVGDYAMFWGMMMALALAYRFVTRKAGHIAYRIATILALLTGFLIFWGNLAVGFIGSEDNPANAMYVGVLLIGVVGAALGRFTASGMAYAMAATALAQFVVPFIALLFWPNDFSPGVLQVICLNSAFTALFVTSAVLFHVSGRPHLGANLGKPA
ncbi:MAG TPA: hypothetical protein PLN52_03275 [Opitutaceae bacterium]|nr:hypothetical protein [Opitutaceae bacterium]